MSALSPSSSLSSTSTSSVSVIPTGTNTHTPHSDVHSDAYIIVLSVLGGITLLCLLGLIAFWCITQRRRNHQCPNESFWRNWHLKTYSRVDTQTSLTKDSPEMSQSSQRRAYDNDDDSETRAADNKGVGIMDWWYGRRRSVLKMVEEGFEVESKKKKLGTVHKVKRYKPNESFEIDSDVRLSTVDVSLIPSRSR